MSWVVANANHEEHVLKTAVLKWSTPFYFSYTYTHYFVWQLQPCSYWPALPVLSEGANNSFQLPYKGGTVWSNITQYNNTNRQTTWCIQYPE